jgi:hypothetical protein
MQNTERIIGRLPSHFQAYNKNSILYKFIDAIGISIEFAEEDINQILLSRWISTADQDELERVGKLFGVNSFDREDLELYRTRIVATVHDLVNGRGTPASIRRFIKTGTGLDPEIVENPTVEALPPSKFLKPGDRWEMFCNSVVDAEPIMYIRGVTTTRNPTITNLSTGESVTYNGLLRKGATLTIYPDGKASLTGIDVSDKVRVRAEKELRLPKGRSVWVYTDANAFIDTAKFNESAFAEVNTVTVELKMEWTERQPAAVVVNVPVGSDDEELKMEIQDLLERVRTVGVTFKIEMLNDEGHQ